MDEKQRKKNLMFYPLSTIGRDMIYSLFTNYILVYVMYTRSLTDAQLAAVTAIIVAARIFDGANDPIMGNLIERTRGRFGKFKPWLAIGMLTTCFVVYAAFNSNLEGWSFIWFFGVIYFLFSITYTMNDISYWGMVTALSEDGDSRNLFTSRATLCAGIGGTAASILIPLFTAGEFALGGSAKSAYGIIALVICILAPLFMLFTLFGVKERRDLSPAPPVSFKKIFSTIGGNDQLLWVCLIFLIQSIGNSIAASGVANNYIYFEFGYEGGLYSTFTTVGMAATAFLMIFYPAISRKFHRKQLMSILLGISAVGYAVQILAGLLLPSGNLEFWVLTVGYMLANFGQYGFYLILMISIFNTVEYNELKHGTRDEAIITSMRPFLTKLSSALVILIAYASYMLCRVTSYTNQISDLENLAERGAITAAEKSTQIAEILSRVQPSQTLGLLLAMTVLPFALQLIGYLLYKKHYKLDEEEYDRICEELKGREG